MFELEAGYRQTTLRRIKDSHPEAMLSFDNEKWQHEHLISYSTAQLLSNSVHQLHVDTIPISK